MKGDRVVAYTTDEDGTKRQVVLDCTHGFLLATLDAEGQPQVAASASQPALELLVAAVTISTSDRLDNASLARCFALTAAMAAAGGPTRHCVQEGEGDVP